VAGTRRGHGAIGEHRFGAARGLDHVRYIKASHSIVAGIVIGATTIAAAPGSRARSGTSRSSVPPSCAGAAAAGASRRRRRSASCGELGAAGTPFIGGIRESIDRHAQPATAHAAQVRGAQLDARAELVGTIATAATLDGR
jgi:hypothetical protein